MKIATPKKCARSSDCYEHAVALDLGFALAWAGVAQTHLWLAGFRPKVDKKPSTLIWPRPRRHGSSPVNRA